MFTSLFAFTHFILKSETRRRESKIINTVDQFTHLNDYIRSEYILTPQDLMFKKCFKIIFGNFYDVNCKHIKAELSDPTAIISRDSKHVNFPPTYFSGLFLLNFLFKPLRVSRK